LDFLGGYGVFTFGHRHPEIIAAVKDQLDRIPLSCKVMLNDRQAELAEKLATIAPGDLEFTFFCNSGAEAVEGALKFARIATGRTKIVATENAYHGKTLGALSASGREKYKEPFRPLLADIVHIPFGNAEAASQAIDSQTAAFIVEPIQGEGGVIVPPEGYLIACQDACRRAKALLIVDEVQTGFGRTGKLWGCDYEGVKPDLLTLAKALGGGVMPIGAVMGTAQVWEKVFGENPIIHTSTFGGNQLACAAGCAAVDVMMRDRLWENSAERGAQLLEGLQRLQTKYPREITGVRGRGLICGVDLYDAEFGELVIFQLVARGVICAYTLNCPQVLRLEPPLVVSSEQVDLAISSLDQAVQAACEMRDTALASGA
jgi:putrescine aminotransferase